MGLESCGMEVFNNLEFSVKCEILKRYAHFIHTITHYHYTIQLFSWDRYFIEVYYDTEEGEITRIIVADDREIEKHLGSIDLEDK